MTVAALDYAMPELLERAGCTLRGRNRADCPRCGARRTVSYTEEVFCCHHAGCDFRGNTFQLARQLGLARRLSPAEARGLRERRERAHTLAEGCARKLRARRQELYQAHRELLSIRTEVHDGWCCESANEAVWDALARVYTELPRVRAELLILETALVRDRLRFLNESTEVRRDVVDRVVAAGGSTGTRGKFIELDEPAPLAHGVHTANRERQGNPE